MKNLSTADSYCFTNLKVNDCPDHCLRPWDECNRVQLEFKKFQEQELLKERKMPEPLLSNEEK